MPIADGGEGTLDAFPSGEIAVYPVRDAFGRARNARVRRDGSTAIVEAAEVIPLDPARLDPLAASTRGLGDLLLQLDTSRVIVGLGAAFAALGATLVSGAAALLDLVGFDPHGFDVVVTGEGTVDATTGEGKAPAEVVRRCVDAGVRCVVFGGIVRAAVPDAETVALSGDPAQVREDLRELGERLGRTL